MDGSVYLKVLAADNWLESEIIGDPDINGDHRVNLLDSSVLGRHWFEAEPLE